MNWAEKLKQFNESQASKGTSMSVELSIDYDHSYNLCNGSPLLMFDLLATAIYHAYCSY